MQLSDSIFSFLYGCQPLHKNNTSKSSKKPNHDRASKNIKQLKTIEKRDFRKVKKHGALVNKVKILAKKSLPGMSTKQEFHEFKSCFFLQVRQT